MRLIHARITLAALALGAVLTAQAAGLGFMARGPMVRFNEADMKLLNGAIEQARNATETGTAVEWANEKTGSSGSVTPVRIYEESGRSCRDLRVLNRHKDLESAGVYAMCRTKDGVWQWKQ